MALTRVADGTAQQLTSGTSGTPGLPAGLAQDDILIYGLSSVDNVGVTSAPGGWILITGRNNGGSHRHEVWAKRAGSSESTPTFVRSGGGTGLNRLTAYRGANSSDALADLFEAPVGSDTGGASSTTATHPAIDIVAGYAFFITFTSYGSNISNGTVFAGSNPTYTNRWNNAGTTALCGQVMEDGENTDGSNVAQRTKSVSNALNIVQVVALREQAVVTSQILLPDADLDVAGWVTAPLFSKINDASDATVVTDGLV
jgi:hypothetical protein